jgi:hypothetical protein
MANPNTHLENRGARIGRGEILGRDPLALKGGPLDDRRLFEIVDLPQWRPASEGEPYRIKKKPQAYSMR